jgi:hypothetical protein
MALETKDQVSQFLALQKKSEGELRAICEPLKLSTEGSKEDLIDRLLKLTDISRQTPIIMAQAIPLRTRGDRSEPLVAAASAIKKWRKLIFEARGNIKEFKLLNGKNKAYKAKLKYIRCSEAVLQHIIKNRWYLPLEHHRDLIRLLAKKPEKFILNIVQKPDSSGNSWLMLHVAPRKAA